MSDAYTYTVLSSSTGETTPPAPSGVTITGGATLSMNDGDTSPSAPCGLADHVGEFLGMPDSSGDTEPKPPVLDGTMPMNLGKTTGAL